MTGSQTRHQDVSERPRALTGQTPGSSGLMPEAPQRLPQALHMGGPHGVTAGEGLPGGCLSGQPPPRCRAGLLVRLLLRPPTPLTSRRPMETPNASVGAAFILVGFSDQPRLEAALLFVVSVFYVLTVLGNGAIVLVARLDARLHTPMYFFLTHLSVVDLCHMTTIAPQMLVHLRAPDRSISLVGCALQFFATLGLGGTECVLLAVMAFDRYVAICQPLHYAQLVPPQLCCSLAGASWALGFGNSLAHTAYGLSLPRCGHVRIHHFYCESVPTLQLVCGDVRAYRRVIFVECVILIVLPLLFIVGSYGCIGWAVVAMRSAEGRRKALGTCGSHLAVVALFYTTLIYMYIKPKGAVSKHVDRFVALFYNLVPPVINPLIYTLRNKDAKGALRRLFLGKGLRSMWPRACGPWEQPPRGK
ncbi:putative olfactory receptor 2W6 [Sorex araneus]|uniref:putative olfactory receptor 2W6 n=1 Tax=Sorex araneus TaxID=42254 RepID=UPI0024336D8F|nr:putative olfactory receptor 2W6 [Sorex araneus]